jgi:hypothetical protein
VALKLQVEVASVKISAFITVGSYNFSVNVVGKGLAFINSTIRSLDFPLEAHSISPNTSGIGGRVFKF